MKSSLELFILKYKKCVFQLIKRKLALVIKIVHYRLLSITILLNFVEVVIKMTLLTFIFLVIMERMLQNFGISLFPLYKIHSDIWLKLYINHNFLLSLKISMNVNISDIKT